MSMNWNVPILVIADDFTGANDSGVQLAKRGATVNVLFDWKNITMQPDTDVLVINTDSRATAPNEAALRIHSVISQWHEPGIIYKKIDSTLRGNLGIEIETILNKTDLNAAIIVSAFPTMGRTTLNGNCYVNGVELVKTEFATDPKTPIYASNIATCIKQQTHLPCLEIHLDEVRKTSLSNTIEKQIQQHNRSIIVLDAQQDSDLAHIMQAVTNLDIPVLLVGSAGLINYFPVNYAVNRDAIRKTTHSPLLVIAGSMSQTTQNQINYALEQGNNWQVVDINIQNLLPKIDEKQQQEYRERVLSILNSSTHCIVRTSCDTEQRKKIEQYCHQYGLTRTALGEHISHFLGLLVKDITSYQSLDALFLTGGDIAISVAKALGATGFRVEGEVSSGVPYGTLIANSPLNYRVFTKAGGFGVENILIKTLEFI